MKIRRRRTTLSLLFLLTGLVSCDALQSGAVPKGLSPVKNLQGSRQLGEVADATVGKASPVGTEHAPVDGKDGMPHEGPFVETSAERNRKKTQETGEDEVVETPLTPSYKEQFSDKDLPQSNDGVMDDRSRKAPVEGTRGVEGGISEKSKDTKPVDKIPDPPKDARPLPHSEAETMKNADGGLDVPPVVEDEAKKPLAVRRVWLQRVAFC